MSNAQRFNELTNEMLKKNSQYSNEISIFKNYLQENNLQEEVFALNVRYIDDYFDYAINNKKIGSNPTLIEHISALKLLFKFLINKKYNFNDLYAHIHTANYKDKLKDKLAISLKKQIISDELLENILYKSDEYIKNNILKEFKKTNEKKRFLAVLISRLYIKMSLILPLKTSEMLNLNIGDIKNKDIRCIMHNGITIKIPNSVRKEIIETIEYVEKNYGNKYTEKSKLFEFLYNTIKKETNSAIVQSELLKTYKELGLEEMLKKRDGGTRDKYIYPPETYKIKAINSMLDNGTNIVYLKKLTGLDIGTLLNNYDIEKEQYVDIVSNTINSGITNTNYYSYL